MVGARKFLQSTLIKKHEAATTAKPTAETTADSQSSAHNKNE